MKYILFIGLLLSANRFVHVQDTVIPRDTGLITLSAAETDQLFNAMLGSWDIKTRAWSPKANKFKELSGSAHFEKKLNGKYIPETFSLDWFGTILNGEGYLKYSPVYKRFDLV